MLQTIKTIELNVIYNYYIIFRPSSMIKNQNNNRHAHHRVIRLEWLYNRSFISVGRSHSRLT